MDVFEAIRRRRSVRAYTGEPIPGEALDRVLAAGLLAPSSKNIRPLEFVCVRDAATLAQLAESKATGAAHVSGAAVAIAVIAQDGAADAWTEDASVALAFMMLEAEERGLGSCWVQIRLRADADGNDAQENVRRILGIPSAYHVEGMLALGVPAKEFPPRDWDRTQRDRIHAERF